MVTVTFQPPPAVNVDNPISNQSSSENAAWVYTVPANTFGGSTNLTFAASLADGSPLPNWMTFDPATATFSGTPPPHANGSVPLKVVASDGTSSVADLFTLNVVPVNDAPTVISNTAALAAIPENTADPAGQTVAAVVSGNFSDASDQVPGGSQANILAGIAVAGNAATAADGTWEYYDGTNWIAISGVSESHALLVSADTPIRFVPAASFTGAAPALTVHLIDDSAGAVTSGSFVDLTATGIGDSTQYSLDTVAISETIAPATLAITAITTDTGASSTDFITNDTTLIVSGTNGALAAGEKIQVSSDGGATWHDVVQNTTTTWSYDDTATAHTSNFTYQARIIDAASNVGTTASQAITIDTTLPAEALAITAITTDTGASSTDFITNDTTLIVSGTNGALARARRSRSAATAAPRGTMSCRTPRRPGATTTPPPRTRRTSPIRRGSSTLQTTSAPPPARPSPSTPRRRRGAGDRRDYHDTGLDRRTSSPATPR